VAKDTVTKPFDDDALTLGRACTPAKGFAAAPPSSSRAAMGAHSLDLA
jgi:hypothetical protein